MNGKFVGPQISFGSPVVETGGVRQLNVGTLAPGQSPITAYFSLINFNGNATPAAWQTFLNAHPQLQALTVRGMEITGPGASAFSLQSSSSFVLNGGPLGPDVAVRFNPPGPGSYSATLRILTDKNADYQQPGDTYEIHLQATALADNYATWAQALPVGRRGETADADGDGVSNLYEFASPPRDRQPRRAAQVFLHRSDRRHSRERARFRHPRQRAHQHPLDGGRLCRPRHLDAPRDPHRARHLGRERPGCLRARNIDGRKPARRLRLRHRNPQPLLPPPAGRGAGLPQLLERLQHRGARHLARLRRPEHGSLRLTDSIGGQTGSAVLDGVEISPNQTGFDAAFTLTTGPTTTGTPADGVSFAVGDLGTASWGENGPATARNLSIAFDTFENGTGTLAAKGIRIMANARSSPTVPPIPTPAAPQCRWR